MKLMHKKIPYNGLYNMTENLKIKWMKPLKKSMNRQTLYGIKSNCF